MIADFLSNAEHAVFNDILFCMLCNPLPSMGNSTVQNAICMKVQVSVGSS